jgi:hypothetical protein
MRALRLLPLVYFMGVHGFVLFTPYLALVMSALYIFRRFRPLPQPVRIS